jgi:hypothetical protein
MKVGGTWGNTEIVVQTSPAVVKSKPKPREAVGLLKLDKCTHMKVLDYLKPDLTVGALLIAPGKERTGVGWGGGGGRGGGGRRIQLCLAQIKVLSK